MARKHYPKKSRLWIEDESVVWVVMDYVLKFGAPPRNRPYYDYLCYQEGDKHRTKVFPEHEVMALVTTQPETINAIRHYELADELGGYECLYDLADKLPNRNPAKRELKSLLEQLALMLEGTPAEHADALRKVESILR